MSFWEVCKLDKKYQKVYVWVFVFSVIYIAAILLANVPYKDDVNRLMYGYPWNHNGRVLMSLVTYIVNGHIELMDISPWSQILAVAFLDYGLVCYVRKLIPEGTIIKSSIVAAFAYVNICLLHNLVYKYEAMAFVLGLGLIFFLYSLPNHWSRRKTTALSALFVFVVLYMYQAVLGAYVALAIFDMFILAKDGASWSKIVHTMAPRLIGFVIGIILWKLIFLCLVSDFINQYTKDHAGLISFMTLDSLKVIYQHFFGYIKIYKDYFQTLKWVEVLLITCMCAGLVRIVYNVWRKPIPGIGAKAASSVFILATPLLLMVASVAPLVFLKSPIYSPRVMMPFTVFTVFQGYIIYELSQYFSKVMIISLLALVITLSHASYYGNLVSCQYKFDEAINWMIVRDTNELEKEQGVNFDKIGFIGPTHMQCREMQLAKKEKPLFERMEYNLFFSSFTHYRMRPMELTTTKKAEIKFKTPVRSNEFYKMYTMGDKIVVVFEKREK